MFRHRGCRLSSVFQRVFIERGEFANTVGSAQIEQRIERAAVGVSAWTVASLYEDYEGLRTIRHNLDTRAKSSAKVDCNCMYFVEGSKKDAGG
jgi:hypothetical protein